MLSIPLNETVELKKALKKFTECVESKYTQEELMGDRMLNECCGGAEMLLWQIEVLLGDKQNPIPNYGY